MRRYRNVILDTDERIANQIQMEDEISFSDMAEDDELSIVEELDELEATESLDDLNELEPVESDESDEE